MAINMAEEKFRVIYDDGKGYAVYYKKGNSHFCYSVNINRHGAEVVSPSRKISRTAYEFAKPYGITI